eukprot:12713008-Prorocentrum_lima.AAC.1
MARLEKVEPMGKFTAAARRWSCLPIGTPVTVKVYKILCFSILSFYLQFYQIIAELFDLEARALLRIFP